MCMFPQYHHPIKGEKQFSVVSCQFPGCRFRIPHWLYLRRITGFTAEPRLLRHEAVEKGYRPAGGSVPRTLRGLNPKGSGPVTQTQLPGRSPGACDKGDCPMKGQSPGVVIKGNWPVSGPVSRGCHFLYKYDLIPSLTLNLLR